MRDILNTYTVHELKYFISKSNIKRYTKFKREALLDLMTKPENIDKFKHIKERVKQTNRRKKPAPKAKPAPAPAPKKPKSNIDIIGGKLRIYYNRPSYKEGEEEKVFNGKVSKIIVLKKLKDGKVQHTEARKFEFINKGDNNEDYKDGKIKIRADDQTALKNSFDNDTIKKIAKYTGLKLKKAKPTPAPKTEKDIKDIKTKELINYLFRFYTCSTLGSIANLNFKIKRKEQEKKAFEKQKKQLGILKSKDIKEELIKRMKDFKGDEIDDFAGRNVSIYIEKCFETNFEEFIIFMKKLEKSKIEEQNKNIKPRTRPRIKPKKYKASKLRNLKKA